MKIKEKKTKNSYVINVSHKELLMLKESLSNFNINDKELKELNDKLFDKDEFEMINNFKLKRKKMEVKFLNILNKITPW